MTTKHLIIFDTSLRDGAQSPGIKMDMEGKIKIAHGLEKLGVDVIEAGFPVSSQENFQTVQAIASQIKNSTICALARANENDIHVAAKAIENAQRKRIHTFIATSAIHMEKKLRMSPDDVVQSAIKAVQYARQFADDIEFSAEDAFRSDKDFLCRIIEAVIKAGATTINLPDTVGYATPFEYGFFFKDIIEKVPNSDKAIFSAHCHDDLGMAVANSLAAVMSGARQVECSMNGIGERAGNAALEEIVMTVKTRKDVFNVSTKIITEKIFETSKMVEDITTFMLPKNKAIVGANAFSHESGIHQDGVLKHRQTYEIMNPSDVGWMGENLVLGKNSGRAALKKFIEDNYSVKIEINNDLFNKFKEIADKKTIVTKSDIDNILR